MVLSKMSSMPSSPPEATSLSAGGSRAAPPTITTATPSPLSNSPPSYFLSSNLRRLSYASVLSGAATAPENTTTDRLSWDPPDNHRHHRLYLPPPFRHQLQDHNHNHLQNPFSDGQTPFSPLLLNADMQMNSAAWRSGTTATYNSNNNTTTTTEHPLPPYSRKFASYPQYNNYNNTFLHGPGSLHDPFNPAPFFTPSYLRNSSYAARLQSDHRARIASGENDDISLPSNPFSTLSSSSSSASSHANLPRIAPSHRGMTHEVIEREPPSIDDHIPPLPTRWSETDKYPTLEMMHGGLELRYTGPLNKHEHEAAAARTDYPMPPQCGIYYFEVTILSKPKDGMIGIGFSGGKASNERLPGWETDSWAYHGDDGKSFFGENQGQGRPYGPTFGVNDTVGCGVNFATGCAFFTKNGVFLGNAFRELKNMKLYPSVGMKKHPTVHLISNFGQQPFMFDIDGMVKREKAAVYSDISRTSTANLRPSLGEDALLHELVAQFLAHDGYIETARAFAEEVAAETAALNGHGDPLKKYEVEEDLEAINRQKIRAAILDGDIDKALKYTNAYYPKVLEDYPHIQFKLRCRKFLEMMRQSNDLSMAAAAKRSKSASNGVSDGNAVYGQEMEVDDQTQDGDGWEADGMDTDDPEAAAKFQTLLTEAVQYGQQLRMDYPTDERGGNKKMLDDIFSLVAYPDPRRSVHGHYLDPAGRVVVAEELNSVILVSLGKASSAALERVYQQTEALVNEPECAFLRENQLALEAVEKNLETAARLGQALLHRHESYIAEAEEDRRRLLDSIDALERERRQVQTENVRMIQENRSLVEQLDALNNTVADSDAHVNSLAVALENTEAELRTVSASAARAAELEAQLNRMEIEQSRLQDSLMSAREDEKSASTRWKKADSTMRELHEQVERLEKEAREERESHADLVQRMERQRTVERELDGAAGRLKGAATVHQHVGRQPHQTSVVSRFVRDILQDNANLQIGVMELRDMLENSNQEVQNLRDQVLSHHPLNHDEGDGEERRPSSESQPAVGKRLSQELDGPRVSPEYHIHHHYHPPSSTPKKEKPKLSRRLTKKRRSLGNPALMHSARQPSVSSTSTILSQTSVSIPPSSHRWSAHSSATESLASSPTSGCHNRPTSIFDRMERGFDSSQPTSPELSPMFKGVARQGRTLDLPFREDSFGRAIEDELANLDALNDHCTTVPAIPEEGEDYLQENGNQRPVTPDMYLRRRRGSHDSFLSVAGMDIHTPSRRRSRTGGPGPIPIAGIHHRNFSSGEVYSTPPVIATTTVTADREAPSKNPHSPRSLLASVCRSQGQSQETENAPAARTSPSRKPSITRRVGGWVRGRWGTAPVAAPAPRPSETASQTQPPSSSPAVNALTRNQNKAKAEHVPAPDATFRFRHPGVNQKGPIMGFRPSSHPPISVHAEVVDEGALRESLAE